MARALAVLLLASLPYIGAQAEERPVVTRIIDAKTGRQTGALSDAQVQEIIRFVRTVSGINHHVQEVDGTSPPQVVVHTGSDRALHGDLLRIEKRHRRWIVLSKGKWRLDDLIERQY